MVPKSRQHLDDSDGIDNDSHINLRDEFVHRVPKFEYRCADGSVAAISERRREWSGRRSPCPEYGDMDQLEIGQSNWDSFADN